MDGYLVKTNEVWAGMVAYREQFVKEALQHGQDLICLSNDCKDKMTIALADIPSRILHYSKPVYRDARTGRYDQRLAYFWWWPDGKKLEPKTDPKLPKQQTLI